MVCKRPNGALENREQIKQIIYKVKKRVENEIELHRSGKGTDGNIRQLKNIYRQLNLMEKFMNVKEFRPTYSRMIVDSWDYNSELGIELLNVLKIYNTLSD